LQAQSSDYGGLVEVLVLWGHSSSPCFRRYGLRWT